MSIKRPLGIFSIGFLLGNYISFIIKPNNIIIMPIICIIGIISGIILYWIDRHNKKINIKLCLIYIFIFIGILFFLFFQNMFYNDAISLSGTNENVLVEIKNINYGSNNSISYYAKIIGFEKNVKYKEINIKLYTDYVFEVGDVFSSNIKFSLPTNHSDFDYRNYLASKGYFLQGSVSANEIPVIIKDLKNVNFVNIFRQYLIKSISDNLDYDAASIANAMLIGDRTNISEINKSNLSKSGLMHIISISGTHFTILTGILSKILVQIGIKRKTTAKICIVFSICYLILVGLDPSVFRSAIMSAIYYFSIIFDKTYDGITSLLFVASLSCLLNPYTIISASFILSYASIIGIYYLVPIVKKTITNFLKHRLNKANYSKIENYILNGFSMSLGVNTILIPFNIYYFKKISLVSLATNILTEPLVPFILILSLLIPFFNIFNLKTFVKVISLILNLICNMFLFISDIFANLPFSNINMNGDFIYSLIVIIVLSFVSYYITKKYKVNFKKQIIVSTILLMIFSYATNIIINNNKTYFYSTNTTSSYSFAMYNKKDVIINIGNSNEYDGRSINRFLDENGLEKIAVLVVLDDKESTLLAAADIIKKNEIDNIIIKKELIKDYSDSVKLINFTDGNLLIHDKINIKIVKNSILIKLNNFSATIINDSVINEKVTITYLKNSISENDFNKLNTSYFINKIKYKTKAYEIIPDKYDEIYFSWDNKKDGWVR